MNCTQIRSIISEAFDANTFTQLNKKVQKHLRHCRQCERYYTDLLQLENSIIAYKQINIPETLAGDLKFEDFSAKISHREKPETDNTHPVKPGWKKHTSFFFPTFARIVWAVIAVMIIFIGSVLLLNKPVPHSTNDWSDSPYLKEAQLDNRPAQVIIYKTESKSNLTVFWLYQ
jgi:predicted anti-sigma-YlaC factor YlaD